MSAASRRGFVLPAVGVTLLFAALGPLVGGALFIPLLELLEAPAAANSVGSIGWLATLLGHAFALIGAYIVGLIPAAATGLIFAMWDFAVPPRSPRALAGAIIGGAMAYWFYAEIAAIFSSLDATIVADLNADAGSWMSDLFAGQLDATMHHGFAASGAVAGFVSALAAALLGLTARAADPAPAPGAVESAS